MNLLALSDGKILVKLARHSIETYFSGRIINLPEADKFKNPEQLKSDLRKFDVKI